MNQKEEGLSMRVVLIALFFIFITIYYITSPVWYGSKTITITSKRPMVVHQYVKEVTILSGTGIGIGSGASGACGELIPGYSNSKLQKGEPIFVIKIFKLD